MIGDQQAKGLIGMACLSGQYSYLQEEAEWNSSHLEKDSEWNTPCRIKCLPQKCLPQVQEQAQYSHLKEEELEWDSPCSNECRPPCWIESLPLELLRKVFLHLTKDDLKVRYIQLPKSRIIRTSGDVGTLHHIIVS